jgi:hypothetical protein
MHDLEKKAKEMESKIATMETTINRLRLEATRRDKQLSFEKQWSIEYQSDLEKERKEHIKKQKEWDKTEDALRTELYTQKTTIESQKFEILRLDMVNKDHESSYKKLEADYNRELQGHKQKEQDCTQLNTKLLTAEANKLTATKDLEKARQEHANKQREWKTSLNSQVETKAKEIIQQEVKRILSIIAEVQNFSLLLEAYCQAVLLPPVLPAFHLSTFPLPAFCPAIHL